MIALDSFLECVQANAKQITGYQLGHDGSDGKCDCIGLIIGAVKMSGEKWPGTHGSNWAARYAMDKIAYIPNTGELFLGEIVYKAHEPWEDNYDLPTRYDDSGDALDYYHVGVVTSVRPLIITHCTGVAGGIKRDGVIGKWRYGGRLKCVDYSAPAKGELEEGVGTMEKSCTATVHSENGKPVNLRSGPSKTYPLIDQVAEGGRVLVIGAVAGDPQWLPVQYKGRIGYMMSQYVLIDRGAEEDTEPEEQPEEQPEDADMVSVPRETLEDLVSELQRAADVLKTWGRDLDLMAALLDEMSGGDGNEKG